MDRAEGWERKGQAGRSFPGGRWQEPAGAGGEEILPRASLPLQPCAKLRVFGLQLCFTWSSHSSSSFFFLMYCQYFKTGRFFLTRIFRLSLKVRSSWLHRVSLPPGTWRGHLSCLCPHHEGHVSSFLQALVS